MVKKLRLFFLLLCFCALFSMVFGVGVRAATEATVTATVTVQNVAISVDDGTITYGTLGQDSTQNTLSGGLDDMQTATNDGNVTSDIDIIGQDSGDWTLGGSAGSDTYTHHFCNDTDDDCDSPPTSYTALTTSYQTLKASVSTSGTVDFQLQINTPNPSTVYTEQSVDVSVRASAS